MSAMIITLAPDSSSAVALVSLMPPAVDPGPAPTNINTMRMSKVGFANAPMSTV